MSNMAFASNIQACLQPRLGVSNTSQNLVGSTNGMDPIGLNSGRVWTHIRVEIGASGF